MIDSLFRGKQVALKPLDVENEMDAWEKWDQDSEYKRQLDIFPVMQFCPSVSKELFENHCGKDALFMVHTVEDDRVIGFVELDGFDWAARSGWVGIGIGEAEYRGKGYGTETMQLLLEYAFRGLNLNRVNLNVFSFNKRAIRSYEKCGFKYEGAQREVIYKEDKRWDVIDMGILRSEWKQLQSQQEE